MHKKLESELISLAHQILQMKNKDDVAKLRDKARDVYEKLSVLTFVDNYFVTSPNVTDSKEEFLAGMKTTIENPRIIEEKTIEKVTEKIPEKIVKEAEKVETEKVEVEKVEEKAIETKKLVEQTVQTIKSEASSIVNKIQTQEPKSVTPEKKTMAEEMKDSIPADVAANMFEKAETLKKEPVIPKIIEPKPVVAETPKVNIATKQEVIKPVIPKETPKASLNDRISNQKIQIGLNDRIAFVKHLFNFSQEEFNRVLSQLNSFASEQECTNFLNNVVKSDYDWSEKQEYEERLVKLIERKFA